MPRLKKVRKLSKGESQVSQLVRLAIRTGYGLKVELIIPPGNQPVAEVDEEEAKELCTCPEHHNAEALGWHFNDCVYGDPNA